MRVRVRVLFLSTISGRLVRAHMVSGCGRGRRSRGGEDKVQVR